MKNLDYSKLQPLSSNHTPSNKQSLAKNNDTCKNEIEKYLDNFKEYLLSLNVYDCASLLIAEQDWIKRHDKDNEIEELCTGRLVLADFGKTYIDENGYIHYALCISRCEDKYLIIPLTTANKEIKMAYHPIYRQDGNKRLYLLKKEDGNKKDAALYINDARYISKNRIIKVFNKINNVAYINVVNHLCSLAFPDIYKQLKQLKTDIKNKQAQISMLQSILSKR